MLQHHGWRRGSVGPTLLLIQTMDGHVLGAVVSDPWKAHNVFVNVERAVLLDVFPRFRAYPTVPPVAKAERNHVYFNPENSGYACKSWAQ